MSWPGADDNDGPPVDVLKDPKAQRSLNQASFLARASEDTKAGGKRMRLGHDTGDPAIPAGCWVHFKPAKLAMVSVGQLVLVRIGSELRIRRLIEVVYTPEGMGMRLASPSGGTRDPLMPARALLGEVAHLEVDGKTFQLQIQGGSPVMNWLTDYGTCKPHQKFVRVLKGFFQRKPAGGEKG